jgi:hypothetical protein
LSKFIIGIGALGGAAGAALALQRAGRPSTTFWEAYGWVVVLAIVIAAVVPPLQSLISEFGERGRRKRAELQTTLHPILAGILIMLVEDASCDWQRTGIQVFKVQGKLWWRRQVLVTKLRLAHVQPSGIKWRQGKGMIGKCWATGEPETRNLEDHYRPYANIDELAWRLLPPNFEKYGLTYEDFQKTKGKFGLLSVFPLTQGDKYIGCVTADMPPDVSEPVDEAVLRRILSAAAPSLAALLSSNK